MINTRLSASSGTQALELSGSASDENSFMSGLSAAQAPSSGKYSSHQHSMAEINLVSGILRNARQHGFISADAKARLGLYQQRRGTLFQAQINPVWQNRGRLLGGGVSSSSGRTVNLDNIGSIWQYEALCDEVKEVLKANGVNLEEHEAQCNEAKDVSRADGINLAERQKTMVSEISNQLRELEAAISLTKQAMNSPDNAQKITIDSRMVEMGQAALKLEKSLSQYRQLHS